jgi:hypothetical protein
LGQGAAQVGHHRLDPALGGGVGLGGRHARLRAGGGDQDDLLGDGVEHRHDRRPGHDPVRQAQGVGVDVRQALGQADHVVAQGPEHAGRRRRQAGRHLDPRAGDQVAQAVQRAARLGREAAGGDVVAFRDLGLVAAAAPDQVRLHGHDRIAPAPGAALDAFEQEGVGPPVTDLQIGRDRGLQIVDQPGPDHLRAAGLVGGGKGVERGLQAH